MQAIEGKMRVPDQAIESGRLQGDVRIRIFEPQLGGLNVPLDQRTPSVVIEAEEADYDAVAGEIHSPSVVRVTTAEASFTGEDLRIFFAPDGSRISRLTMERAIEPIIIRPSKTPSPTTATSVPANRPPTNLRDEPARNADPADPSGPAGVTDASAWSASRDAGEGGVRIDRDADTEGKKDDAVDPDAWYRLILEDEVLVERLVFDADGVATRSTVEGDRLVATFAMGEGGLDASFASVSPVPASTMPLTASSLISVSAMTYGPVRATRFDEPESAVVRVHFSGRLVMVPDPDAVVRMKSRADAEVVIESVSGDGITLADEGNDATGSCARLEYRTQSERIDLIGDDRHPLIIESPRFALEGGRFWMVRADGEGGLVGAGRMRFEDDGAMRVRSAFRSAADLYAMGMKTLLAAGPGAEHAVAFAAVSAIGQDDPPAGTGSPRLEIVWEGGVDLDFDDLEDDGRLEQARFRGDVKVASDNFKLGSDALVVEFAAGGDGEAIERILATGGARVDRVGEIGSLEATSIDLALGRTEDGQTIPTAMVAEGEVEASDPGQTLWTNRLVVRFRPRAEDENDASATTGITGELAGGDVGAVEITTVDAADGVQVRLEEGARVFADRLKGDGVNRTLQLEGDDVMVLRANVVADRLRDVQFDDVSRTVRGTGPGRFRYYDESVVPESKGRIDRPSPPTRTSLAATWSQSMLYNEAANQGGGRLDLEGDVRVRSTPDPMTSDRLDARRISLDLSNEVGGVRPAGERDQGLLGKDGGKKLDRLIARGEAVLESRTWNSAARRGDPRLFRVNGDHVEYTVASREALVDGPGGLLVHDPVASSPKAERGAASTAGFGIDGTSRFRWARRMTMNREVDDRYLVIMERDVEVLHAGIDPADTLSMTADRFEVTIERPQDRAEADLETPDGDSPVADAEPSKVAEGTPDEIKKDDQTQKKEVMAAGVELGGPAELVRVRGIGRVFVRTPDHDIECQEFDYNVDTQIAMLRASPGRVVTVQSKGAATPIRAERVQWDLRTGRIRILGGEGGIAR
jgi:lipopolysaccharide export system protein LptA